MTFFEFQKRFPTETAALNFIVATKYANGYYCPKCGCFHKGIYRSNKRGEQRFFTAITANRSS